MWVSLALRVGGGGGGVGRPYESLVFREEDLDASVSGEARWRRLDDILLRLRRLCPPSTRPASCVTFRNYAVGLEVFMLFQSPVAIRTILTMNHYQLET